MAGIFYNSTPRSSMYFAFFAANKFSRTVSKLRVKHFSIVGTKRNKIHVASYNMWLCRLTAVLSRASSLQVRNTFVIFRLDFKRGHLAVKEKKLYNKRFYKTYF